MTASGWWTGEGRERRDARARYREYGDRALVEAIRTFDGDALEEFIERFQHLVLLEARRFRVRPEDRKGWAADLLYDVASSICRPDPRDAPRALIPYLKTACRRKALAERRTMAVRERTDAALMGDVGGAGQKALLNTCSEDAVRRTYAPDVDPVPLPAVLERLVSVFDEGASAEELLLLGWVAQRSPYSLISVWLGVSRSATIKRVTRLRARLIDAAMRFGESLGREDRVELLRFLRRSGSFTAADLAALNDPGQASGPSMNRPTSAAHAHRAAAEEEDEP